MTIERIREVLKTQPFRPFTLNLADGRAFHVPHPEYIAVTGKGRTVIVTDPSSASIEMIDLLLVTSISVADGDQAA